MMGHRPGMGIERHPFGILICIQPVRDRGLRPSRIGAPATCSSTSCPWAWPTAPTSWRAAGSVSPARSANCATTRPGWGPRTCCGAVQHRYRTRQASRPGPLRHDRSQTG